MKKIVLLLCSLAYGQEEVVFNTNKPQNVRYSNTNYIEPMDVEEVISLINDARENNTRLKPVGSGHSFNDISDTDGIQISMINFKEIEVDTKANKVWFGAGVTFLELNNEVKANNRALFNTISYPHINVVGAVVTGSHGSGHMRSNFASYVTAM